MGPGSPEREIHVLRGGLSVGPGGPQAQKRGYNQRLSRPGSLVIPTGPESGARAQEELKVKERPQPGTARIGKPGDLGWSGSKTRAQKGPKF